MSKRMSRLAPVDRWVEQEDQAFDRWRHAAREMTIAQDAFFCDLYMYLSWAFLILNGARVRPLAKEVGLRLP